MSNDANSRCLCSMCSNCNKFHPGSIDHCEIVKLLDKVCWMHCIYAPILECPEWEEKLVVI
jgi:L-lactate utilization protein LutB